MKLFKYMAMIIAALCMMGTFVSCEEKEEEVQEESADNNLFERYFKTTIESCERVGDVLIVDLTITNKSGKDVQDLTFRTEWSSELGKSRDDLNNELRYDMTFSLNGGSYKNSLSNVSILAGESIKLKIHVRDFDKTNSASYVWLYVNTPSDMLKMGMYSGLKLEKLKVTDKRVLSKGIQTNDRKLSYTFTKAQRDENNNDVYMYFKLKNNTGMHLRNIKIESNYNANITDNLGNSYYMEFGADKNYMSSSYTTDLEVGAEMEFIVKVSDVAIQATRFSGHFDVNADNYVMDDNVLNFFNLGLALNN